MRVIFSQPTEYEFKRLLSANTVIRNNYGGSLSDIRIFTPTLRRRGGGFFADIAKKVLPFLVKNVTPAAKEFGASVIKDVLLDNKPIRNSIRKRGVNALKNVGRSILKGSGRVKKRKNKAKKAKTSTRSIKDVYSLI